MIAAAKRNKMILIDAFICKEGALYHVSGPIDTEDASWGADDWFEKMQKAGRVKLSLPAIEISDEDTQTYIDIIKNIRTNEDDKKLMPREIT